MRAGDVYLVGRNETWEECVCLECEISLDLERTVTRTGPHDGGVGRPADAAGGLEVGEYETEGTTRKYIIFPVARRDATSVTGLGKFCRLRRASRPPMY